MPKITRYGGHSNAGLTERVAGFSDTTAATLKTAKSKAVVPEPTVTVTEPDPEDIPEPPPFDPGEYTVADVLAVRSEYTDTEWATVVTAERNGKNRAGITSS